MPRKLCRRGLQAHMLSEISLFPEKEPGKARNPWKLGAGCAKDGEFP